MGSGFECTARLVFHCHLQVSVGASLEATPVYPPPLDLGRSTTARATFSLCASHSPRPHLTRCCRLPIVRACEHYWPWTFFAEPARPRTLGKHNPANIRVLPRQRLPAAVLCAEDERTCNAKMVAAQSRRRAVLAYVRVAARGRRLRTIQTAPARQHRAVTRRLPVVTYRAG